MSNLNNQYSKQNNLEFGDFIILKFGTYLKFGI